MIKASSFLAMEASLADRLQASYRKATKELFSQVATLLSDQKFEDATQAVQSFSLHPIAEENSKYIEYMTNMAMLFGASRVTTTPGTSKVGLGFEKTTSHMMVQLFKQTLFQNGEILLKKQALQLIANERDKSQAVQKKDKSALYISRRLQNADDFIKWAKGQGFTKVIEPSDIHVTIAYSKKPVDWDATGSSTDTAQFSGGKRTVEPLGSEGAVVLKFAAKELSDRWQELKDFGASWDYERYQPHITITYDVDPDLDLEKVQPYEGVLEFGPEIYEPLDTEWKDTVVEKGARHGQPGAGGVYGIAGSDYASELDSKGISYERWNFKEGDPNSQWNKRSSNTLYLKKGEKAIVEEALKKDGYEVDSIEGEAAVYKKGGHLVVIEGDMVQHLNPLKDKPVEIEKSIHEVFADSKSNLDRYHEGREQPLTQEQSDALGVYKGSGFEGINRALRQNEETPEGNVLSGLLHSRTVGMDGVVFRGVTDHSGVFANLEVGSVIKDKAFTSWSADAKVASHFASEGGVVFGLKIQKSTNGLRVDHHRETFGEKESEVLLPQRKELKVLSVTKKGSMTFVEVGE